MESSLPSRVEQFRARMQDIIVGRETELKKLTEIYGQVESGQGAFVMITGEAGIGKTKLVRLFIQHLSENGIPSFEVKIDPLSRYEPFVPFHRTLEELKAFFNHSDSEQASSRSSGSPGNGKSRENSQQDQADLYLLQNQYSVHRQRLVGQLLSFARQMPYVLVITDIHRASLTVWRFFHYLARNIIDQPLLILSSLRQDGREANREKLPVYADVLQKMNRERLIRKLQLRRFTKQDTRAFLHQMFGRSDFSSTFVHALWQISEGLPDVLCQILENLYETGALIEEQGIWFDQRKISKEDMSELVSVDGAIQLINEIDKERDQLLQEILNVSALLQPPFSVDILNAVIQCRRLDLIKKVDFLIDKKIFMEHRSGGLHFKRPEIQAAILKKINPSETKLLHSRIAHGIENNAILSESDKIFLLAYHYSHGTEVKKSIPYLKRAFYRSISNYAFIEAREFYEQLSALIDDENTESFGEEFIELHLKMIWLDRVLGNYEDSLEHADKALEVCKPGRFPEMYYSILIQKGLTYFRLNEWEKSLKCFRSCLENFENAGLFIRAMANYGLGNVFLETARYDLARKYYLEAVRLAELIDEKLLIGRLYNNLGIIENILGNRMVAINYYSKSIPIYKALEDHLGLALAYNNIGMTYCDEASWEKANEFYGLSLRISDEMGLVPAKSIAFLNRALALTKMKKFDEAKEYNFKAYRLLKRLKDDLGMAEYYKIQGIIDREQKNFKRAQKNLQLAVKKFKAAENALGFAETCYELALLAHAVNNDQEAREWYSRAQKEFQLLGISEKAEVAHSALNRLEQDPKPAEESEAMREVRR